MRDRSVADGVAWPIPSISGAHAHTISCIYRMRERLAPCADTFMHRRVHNLKPGTRVSDIAFHFPFSAHHIAFHDPSHPPSKTWREARANGKKKELYPGATCQSHSTQPAIWTASRHKCCPTSSLAGSQPSWKHLPWTLVSCKS